MHFRKRIKSNFSYVYDDKDQLIRENDQKAGKTLVYTYNDGANITSKKEYAYTTGTLGTVQATKTYSYGSTAWKDKLTSYDGNSLNYDSMGNLTSDGEWTYTWEHGSQLLGMTKTGIDAAFGYDDVNYYVSYNLPRYYDSGDYFTVENGGMYFFSLEDGSDKVLNFVFQPEDWDTVNVTCADGVTYTLYRE